MTILEALAAESTRWMEDLGVEVGHRTVFVGDPQEPWACWRADWDQALATPADPVADDDSNRPYYQLCEAIETCWSRSCNDGTAELREAARLEWGEWVAWMR